MAYRETEKTRQRKAENYEHIVATALELVSLRGFRGVSINDVAAAAGIATGSVYRHFESKEALFSAVFRRATQREVDKVSEALQPPGRPRDRLAKAIDVFARRAIEGRRIAWALIAEPVDPRVEADRLEYRGAYATCFSAIIDEGIACGDWPCQSSSIGSAAIVGALAEALVGPLAPVDADALHPPVIAPADRLDADALVAGLQTFILRALTGKESP